MEYKRETMLEGSTYRLHPHINIVRPTSSTPTSQLQLLSDQARPSLFYKRPDKDAKPSAIPCFYFA